MEIALTLSLALLVGLTVAALFPAPQRHTAMARVRYGRRVGR